jgi:hypothetical protein
MEGNVIASTVNTGSSAMDFFHGEAFMRIANAYPTLHDILLENVQNSLDIGAKNVEIRINYKKRYAHVRDNGDGVTKSEFEQALVQVCKSRKEMGKLGRFGIGLISPLGKCEKFRFISSPRSNRKQGYLSWSFVTDEIRCCGKNVSIPWSERKDLIFFTDSKPKDIKSFQVIQWKTSLEISNFSMDKRISHVEMKKLKEDILDRYEKTMRRNEAIISIIIIGKNGREESEEFQARKYTGKKLDEITIHEKDAGDVSFDLYISPRTEKGRKGKVLVGESKNDFRFPFAMFAKSLDDDLIAPEVVEALNSGLFEGEITGEKVELHSSRRKFEINDALVGFCAAIDQWYRNNGANHIQKAKEAHKEKRYQQLGIRSLKVLNGMLKNEAFKKMNEVFDLFARGNIGSHHAEKKIIGEQEEPSLSPGGKKTGKFEGGQTDLSNPEKDKPKHHPTSVLGPEGRKRKIVKNDSLGLQFGHDDLDSRDLWELDIQDGTLWFNITHPDWVECDKNDRHIMQLQEYVAIQVLTLYSFPEEQRESQEKIVHGLVKPYIFLIKNSDTLAERSPGRKKR